MYIIFNQDGSIKESQLNDYINQYSDGVNYVDIAIDGMTYDKFTASVVYTFSNGETATDSATKNVAIATSSGTYKGWRFVLHSAYTQYDGNLLASYVGTSSSGAQLFSYPAHFTVNFTSSSKQTELTWEEYKSLKASMSDYQLQYSLTNVRGYFAPALANADLENLAEYQLVITPDSTNSVGRSYELYYVDQANGGRTLTNLAIGLQGNKDYFLWKKDLGEKSDVQNVFSGFVSQYEDSDGNQVNFGTDEVTSGKGFYVNVLDKSNNYTGAISLGAKNYKFAYDSAVDVFSSDGNTTAIKSPMGSASVSLTNGQVDIVGTAIYYGNDSTPTNHVFKGMATTFNTYWLTFNCAGTIYFNNGGVWFTYEPPTCSKTPSIDSHLANKSYVDKTAEEQATEKANIEKQRAEYYEGYLQDQVDAINKSQNFVATFATHQDLVYIDMSKLDHSDCVLILKDEDHNDQSTVYRYKGGPGGLLDMFEFVGELGDYYTKAYINAEFAKTNGNVAYYRSQADSYAKKVDDYANATDDKIAELGKVVDTAKDAYLASTPTFVETSSSTEESDVTPTLVGLFAETGSSTTISE